jgi:hypothetical protein
MIQRKFDDMVLSENDFDSVIPKLVSLSHLHSAVTININTFTKLLKHGKLLHAIAKCEPITSTEILRKGLYYKINHMNVYVARHVQDGCYEIGGIK